MEHFISMYIDNELSLDEKILFVEQCHDNKRYADDAVSLLNQEKILSASLNMIAPEVELTPYSRSRRLFSVYSLGWAIAACLLVVISFTLTRESSLPFHEDTVYQAISEQSRVPYRFVIQQHNSQSVEITGSFTGWQPVALSPTGSEGYWELNLDLTEGEHRYTYIIDGSSFVPDPTVPSKESDDFGSTNTILHIKA